MACSSLRKSKLIDFVIGAPSWKKAWSLPLWFESVRANVDPSRTGLAFVVPQQDTSTRDTIEALAGGFKWVDIQRDKFFKFDADKIGTFHHHKAMAIAKNCVMSQAIKTTPKYFIGWDTDLILPPGTVEAGMKEKKPLVGVWSWLNRQKPDRYRHVEEDKRVRYVKWEAPMQATAMRWVGECKAIHFPSTEWELRSKSTWKADVVLGFQMMTRDVYTGGHIYRGHPDGEDLPFHWGLERKGIPRYIMGEQIGVHLHKPVTEELTSSWPDILEFANQRPLAAEFTEPRSRTDELLGFYPER